MSFNGYENLMYVFLKFTDLRYAACVFIML